MPRAGGPRPCRPSPRIAAGGGPTQRIPAAIDGLGEVRVLGEEPEARDGARRRRPRRPPATTAATSSRSSAPGPSVAGTTARIPSRSQVRVMRAAISPRLAMNSVRIGVRRRLGRAGAVRRARTRQTRQMRHASDHRRVARAAAARDPALDRPCRRPDARGGLARTQFLGHRVAIVAYHARTRGPPGRQPPCATYGSGVQAGPRFSVNARKPSWPRRSSAAGR